jgi:hypothetical protein
MARRRLGKLLKKRMEESSSGSSRSSSRKRRKGPSKKGWPGLSSKSRTAIIIAGILLSLTLLSYVVYTVQKENEREDWTVMVYMAGDNSLNYMIGPNLDAMEKIGSNKNLDIVALADGSGDQDSHLYHVEKGRLTDKGLGNITIYSPGEVDTGNPRTLSDFGEWVIGHYPSKHYLLIIWGHGNGWQGLAEDKSGSSLTLSELNQSLKEIVTKNQGRKLDIIGFDACAMATMEGYYQLSPFADYLVASEKKEPDAGWPYEKILGRLKDGTVSDPKALSKAIVEDFVNAYSSGTLPNQDFSVGMTALRTSEGSDFSIAFQRFADALNDLEGADRMKAKDLRGSAPSFEDKDSIDLLAYAAAVKGAFPEGSRVRQEAEKLLGQGMSGVVAEDYWNNPNSSIIMDKTKGICVYFPSSSNNFDQSYSSISIARTTYWDEFISMK